MSRWSIVAARLGLGLTLAACAQVHETPRQLPQTTAPAVGATPAAVTIGDERASRIAIDTIGRYPEPGWRVPTGLAFAPGSETLTYLASEDGGDVMSIHELSAGEASGKVVARASDLAGKVPVKKSAEEELRDERARKRIKGITSYAWAKTAPAMLVPFGGDLYLRRAGADVVRLTETPEPEIDPKLCADAQRVVYVRDGDLFELTIEPRSERRLTDRRKKGVAEGVTFGLSDFNAQEEFGEPSGFWLSDDCATLAYLEVDESKVGTVPVMGYRQGKPDLMQQKYPLVGERNPKVTLHVRDLKSQRDRTVPIADEYLGRFAFSRDGASLWFMSVPRVQRELRLERLRLKDLARDVVYRERDPAFVEMTDFEENPADGSMVVIGARGDHRHLVRVASSGEVKELTSGAWDVFQIARITDSGSIFFVANADETLGRHLYVVESSPAGNPAPPRRLTPESGTHQVVVSPSGKRFVDVSSAIDRRPSVAVVEVDTGAKRALALAADPRVEALGLRAPALVDVPGADGKPLYGYLLAPRDVRPDARYPAIVMVYGGPGIQVVRNRWAPLLLWQHLADRGFYVMQFDNRGGEGRGPAFARAVHGELGRVEAEDQLRALDAMLAKHPIDPARVGIYGHSYGGYMTLSMLFKSPRRFRAGVAASPVTDFRLYDTGYTERYMGPPDEKKAGYDASNLSPFAKNLEADLMVVHALMDENVHFDNTARLLDALTEAQKPFDFVLFPGERHGYRGEAARVYASRRVISFFVEHLGPRVPDGSSGRFSAPAPSPSP